MANPRKFSEKIALHNQKQAEETAAFEKIMREVSDATSKVSNQVNLTPGLGSFRGGSLPNVSEPKRKPQQSSTVDTDEIKPDETTLQQYGLASMQHSHMNDNNNVKSNETQTRGRPVGVGPIRRPGDRKIDTSPYSGGNVAYLSPPSDSSWRRTSSDSAIHQSLTQTQDHHIYGTHSPFTLSPAAQRRITNVSSNIDIKSYANQHANNQHNNIMSGTSNDGRPRSSCGLPRLPGINIYPSHDNSIQIPIGNNTGSLPDLTSVHFPSPLHTPIDQEHDHSSSPYSSSPITASPTTLSPTSIPTRHPNATFQYSPSNSNDSNNTFSPTHHSQHSQQYLSVPDSKYHHVNKGIENAYQPPQSGSHHQQQQQQQQTHQSYGNISNQQINYHNSQHSPPNNALHGSHGNLTNLGNIPQSNLGYRSPKCRPSPGSSPGLAGSLPNSGDSNTSAPCSPASQGNNGQYENNFYLNPSIQHTFEQFSLDWAALVQSLVESGCTWTAQVQVDSPVQEYITAQSPNAQNYQSYDDSYSHMNNSMDTMQHQQHQQQPNSMQQQNSANLVMSNQKMPNSMSNSNSHVGVQSSQSLNTSQHVSQQQHQQQSLSQQQQLSNSQAPNTPTSIPEIIFTDFSSASELSKDLFGDPLRPIDLELGTMDFAGYQMLTDPNGTMIADPTIEDSFRRDLN